jgi:sarcosine oxidase subunit beta
MAPVLEQVIGVANADVAGRQEATGAFRVTSGAEPWAGDIEDGPAPVVRPTLASLAATIERFGHVVPAFCGARLAAIWAGLIDLTPDALPVIDTAPDIDGLIVAMGFSGHGFCLGPLTGKILADLAQGRDPERERGLPLEPFRIARFAGWNGPAGSLTLHG